MWSEFQKFHYNIPMISKDVKDKRHQAHTKRNGMRKWPNFGQIWWLLPSNILSERLEWKAGVSRSQS